ncbi:MAG: hypothetical protein K0S96_1600 [Geminicoccaceae bacterium]|nr:hypothetical protein [Geminicoccaceae bacterium]
MVRQPVARLHRRCRRFEAFCSPHRPRRALHAGPASVERPDRGAAGPSGAEPLIYLRASLRPLPGLNLARFEAGILIGAPVRGLRPSLALRSVTE